MIRLGNKLRLTPEEARHHRAWTQRQGAPTTVESYNRDLEQTAAYWAATEDSPESALLQAMLLDRRLPEAQDLGE